MSWFKSDQAIVVDFTKKQVVKKFKAIEIKKIQYPVSSETEEEEVDVSPVNISNISE